MVESDTWSVITHEMLFLQVKTTSPVEDLADVPEVPDVQPAPTQQAPTQPDDIPEVPDVRPGVAEMATEVAMEELPLAVRPQVPVTLRPEVIPYVQAAAPYSPYLGISGGHMLMEVRSVMQQAFIKQQQAVLLQQQQAIMQHQQQACVQQHHQQPLPTPLGQPMPFGQAMSSSQQQPMSSGQLQQQQQQPVAVLVQQQQLMPSGQQQQQHDDDRSSLAIHTVGIPRTDFPILPEDIILGMCCAEHTVDIYDFMSKVLMEQSMSPSFSVEEHPDLAKLFHVVREDVGRVQCNPFWMLVSYVPSRNMWEPAKSDFRYRIDDMPDLEAICKSAKGLHDRLHAAVTTDIMWCEMSEMSRTSLKMVLACLWLVAGKLFSCMAVCLMGLCQSPACQQACDAR